MVSQKENQPRSSGARQSDANDGKDPVRVEAGKKAAETRKRHEQEAAEGRGAGGDAQVEGGKKAAATRKSNDAQDSSRDQDDQGKDPVRVEAGKKAAAHRSHEDFVEMGKKGGEARREEGATAEGQDDGKDPVRVEAGKKAAETRKRHEQEAAEGRGDHQSKQGNKSEDEGASRDQGNDGKDPVRVEAGKKAAAHFDHEHFVELGKKSGEVRRERAAEHEHEKDPVRVEAGKKAASHFDHEHFVELGKKSGEARRQQHDTGRQEEGDDEDVMEVDQNEKKVDGKDPVRVEAGKKAAETRKRHEQEAVGNGGNQSPSGDDDADDQGKDPVRVEAGKKAAETRKAHASTNEDGKDPVRVEAGKKAAAHRSHEDFVEMGKKGGEARREQSNANNDQMEEGEVDAEYDGKDPVRVEAGKKAAAHFDHEHFVELGKMGAEARWHGKHQHDDESAAEDPKAKNARVVEEGDGNDAE